MHDGSFRSRLKKAVSILTGTPLDRGGYFDYVAAQKKAERLARISGEIREIEDLITDIQMYRRCEHEGAITLSWVTATGEEKELALWMDGDFTEGAVCGEFVRFLLHAKKRRQVELRWMMEKD